MHSLIMTNGTLQRSHLEVDEFDNKIHTQFGEFGWEVEKYATQESKLSYLVTMLIETEEGFKTVDEFFKTEGFKKINKAISEYCNCDGIAIDSRIEPHSYTDEGETDYWLSHDGYIDHQSCECYASIDDFLNDYHTDIINFIFNDGIIVCTDNDNH